MNLKQIYSDVQIQLGETVPYSLFFSALTRVLKRINIEGEKEESFLTLTGDGDWEDTIDLDEEIIGTDDRLIDAGRWLYPYSWDSINNALTLPKSITKILALYVDDEIATSVPYDVLMNLAEDELYYTSISNHLYFNTDLDAGSQVIKIKVRADYSLPVKTDEEYEGLPDSAEEFLKNGILSVMYSQPQHYDDRLQALHRRQFEDDLYAFNMQVMTKQPQEHQEPQYTY